MRATPVLCLLGLVLALRLGAVEGDPPAFRVVVHADSRLTTISREDLKKVLLGTKTAVRGRRVTPVLLDGGEAHAAFTRQVVGKSPRAFSAYWKRRIFSGQGTDPVTVPSSRAMVAYLRNHPHAIGYVAADEAIEGVKEVTVTE